jgi:hypothetical protein
MEALEDRCVLTSSTTLTLNSTEVDRGQAVLATASVTDTIVGGTFAVLIGQVTFSVDGQNLGSVRLEGTNGTVQMSIATSGLSADNHNVKALFNQGGIGLGDSSCSGNILVLKPTTAQALPILDNHLQQTTSFPLGTPVELQASVQAVGSLFPPNAGAVSFLVDGNDVGDRLVTLGGLSTLFIDNLPAGRHSLQVKYTGNTDPTLGLVADASTPSSAIPFTVTLVDSTTTLTSSSPVQAFGVDVTFKATVPPSGDLPQPTGTVTFTIDSVVQHPVSLASGGTASFTATNLLPGPHTITAAYSGDSNYNPSTANLVQTIQPLTVAPTLQAVPSAGAGVTLMATLAGETFGGTTFTPTGAVTFFNNGIKVDTVALQAGKASLSLAALTPGLHHFTAQYSGDAIFTTAASLDLPLTGSPAEGSQAGVQDVTGLVTITLGKVRRRGGLFRQKVTLRNHGTSPIGGPVLLVMQDLSRRITLLSARGTARLTRAAGSPNAVLILDASASLLRGKNVTVDLAFRGKTRGGLQFTPQVLAGASLG